MNKVLQNKIDFCLLVEMSNTLLNGDPDNNGEQRTLSDGRVYATDACIKRIAREYTTNFYSHISGFDVFMRGGREESIFELAHEIPCEKLFGKSFKKCSAESNGKKDKMIEVTVDGVKKKVSYGEILQTLQKEIISHYWDQRVFGTAPTVKFTPFHGCVCFVSIKSVFPAYCDVVSTTTCMAYNRENDKDDEKDKDNKTFGSRSAVEHALVMIIGTIDISSAQKTGMTELDYEILREALIYGFEGLSSTRNGNRTVFYADTVHSTDRGSGNAKDIFLSGIGVFLNDGIEFSSSLDDYKVTIGKLPNDLKLNIHHKSPDLNVSILKENSLTEDCDLSIFSPLDRDYVASKAKIGV